MICLTGTFVWLAYLLLPFFCAYLLPQPEMISAGLERAVCAVDVPGRTFCQGFHMQKPHLHPKQKSRMLSPWAVWREDQGVCGPRNSNCQPESKTPDEDKIMIRKKILLSVSLRINILDVHQV
jgi:hypothetical protein